MSVRTRIVLGTLCTWNGGLLFALGVIALLYVDGLAGKLGAVLFWVAGWSLFVLARRLRSATDW